MSFWKISKAPERWVAAELVLAFFVATAPLTAHEVYEQRSEHAQRATEQHEPGNAIAAHGDGPNAEVAHKQAAEEHHAESGPLGLSAEEWIAVFTVVLAIATIVLCAATIGLWLETRNIRRDSERALRTLERAYLFPVLLGSPEQLSMTLDGNGHHGSKTEAYPVQIIYALKNFGKTAATILHVEATLVVNDGAVGGVEAQVPLELVLGENETTSMLTVTRLMKPPECLAILSGERTLILQGFVNYLDIWGQELGEVFVWKYDHKKRRMLPIRQPKTTDRKRA